MSKDAIEVEVIEELPLEKVIDNTLVKNNVTKQVIGALKEKYGQLRLRSIDNEEDYLEIKEARKEVRKVGIIAEKICKVGREDAIKIQKLWLGKEREVLGEIARVQDPLDAEIKKFEDEVERLETIERNKKENEFMVRQTTLLKYGATFSDNKFVLNNIEYEVSNIKEADEEVWNGIILPKYKTQFEKNEAVRVEEENKREAAAKELKRQQDELVEQKRVFEEQQKELERQKSEHETEQRKISQQKQEEENKKRQQLIESRSNELRGLGLTFDFKNDCFRFGNVNVDNKTEISLLDENGWASLMEKITPVIEQRKKEVEQKRLNDIEEQKKKFAEEEKQRLEREKKLEEEKKRQELEQSSDKVKWEHFISGFRNITSPEFKSPTYKGKIAKALSLIEELQQL